MNTSERHLRLVLVLAIALAAAVTAGCGNDDGGGNPDSRLSQEQAAAPIEGAPPALAAIRSEASELLDGGVGAFEERIAEVRGFPVVVNKWASWCGPCRYEFPWFQSAAQRRGGEIAFLGVDSQDSEAAAERFLGEFPLPYPSYSDPDEEIAEELGGPPQAFPSTAFYDRNGELVYTHPGVYGEEEDLIADIERWAR